MSANEMRVFLRHDGSIRNDPGPPLNKLYESITIKTSSEEYVFNGRSDTARGALDYIRLAHAKHGTATSKDKACHAAIKADKGAVAHIVFKDG
ncbi:hypothetical protein [Mesorhizobium amorphae]|uniref:hypothetical protein n=1 Tax=Mesorhizobium amorphae TaxID=71433 RepID=UPI001783B5BE|nr:hypothetical protein [Mesorhizobium amorphae]